MLGTGDKLTGRIRDGESESTAIARINAANRRHYEGNK
jgi:hypothetical protein